ncbi:MAG: OmpA family protein [Kiloniellales bacterium]|nr:OmpA family protein [Kiloniellales bacterium]
MNRRTPLILLCAFGCAIGVAACGLELQKAEKIEPATDEHGDALYQGYLGQSRLEYSEGDYRDSDYFAERAMMAGANQKFEPQLIEARDLPADKLNEMAAARGQYITAVYRGSVQKLPVTSAEAQVRFDCWMQEQEENFQPKDIAACRDGFETAMVKLEAALSDTGRAVSEDRLVFDVFFDFDSDSLSAVAKEHLAAIAAITRTYERPVVAVLGNADQVGATDYNVDLSGRRANVVAKELEANGVKPDAIIPRGDQAPAVANPERRPEAMNRRALIVIREATPN